MTSSVFVVSCQRGIQQPSYRPIPSCLPNWAQACVQTRRKLHQSITPSQWLSSQPSHAAKDCQAWSTFSSPLIAVSFTYHVLVAPSPSDHRPRSPLSTSHLVWLVSFGNCDGHCLCCTWWVHWCSPELSLIKPSHPSLNPASLPRALGMSPNRHRPPYLGWIPFLLICFSIYVD